MFFSLLQVWACPKINPCPQGKPWIVQTEVYLRIVAKSPTQNDMFVPGFTQLKKIVLVILAVKKGIFPGMICDDWLPEDRFQCSRFKSSYPSAKPTTCRSFFDWNPWVFHIYVSSPPQSASSYFPCEISLLGDTFLLVSGLYMLEIYPTNVIFVPGFWY